MAGLEIKLFGEFRVWRDGKLIEKFWGVCGGSLGESRAITRARRFVERVLSKEALGRSTRIGVPERRSSNE